MSRFQSLPVVATILFLLPFGGPKDEGFDLHVKPWDSHASVIETTVEYAIPDAFVPETGSVYVESVTVGELMTALGLLYRASEVGPRVAGLYLPSPEQGMRPNLPTAGRQIYLSDDLTRAQAKETLVHEWGHFVWFETLTRTEQATFVALWTLDKATGKLPSEYAGVNPWEGFAEAFEEYSLRDGKALSEGQRGFLAGVEKRLTE